MKVVYDYPPNYKEICSHFDIKDKSTIVFTYGDTVYVPSKVPLSPDLVVHENTHIEQQAIIGADKWWELYFKDQDFRLKMELEAYQKQYKSISNRDTRRKVLKHISKDLSGKMYGNILTKDQAKEMITS